jgi:hypothetical protein
MKAKFKLIILVLIALSFSSTTTALGLDAIDLAITPSGYTTYFGEYTYSVYVDIMAENGAEPADFMLVHDPIDVAALEYYKGDILVFIEVFKYQTTEQAVEEYAAQRKDRGGGSKLYNGPMFERFVSRDRIFQHQNYIAVASFDSVSDSEAHLAVRAVFEEFIENAVQVISNAPGDPPAPNGDEAIWGIQVGDTISWLINDDSFTGTITSGGSSSSANWTPEIEIVEISPTGHAVLIKEQSAVTEYWWEDEARAKVNFPYEGHSWRTIHNNGMTITDSSDKQTMPLIYPVVLNGAPMTDLLDEAISGLPEKSYTDGADSYSVFGKTRSGSGYTPVETQWLDITIHRGTGIITSYDWYYNNNDYGITARSQIGLGGTNFNLASRAAPVTALKDFTGDIYVDPYPATVGDTIEVQIDLFDADGASISDASVYAIFKGTEYTMNEQGAGLYVTSIDTDDLSAGDYEGTLVVEKSGFEAAEGGFEFTLTGESTPPDPEPTPDGTAGGIPGMPISSLIMGASIVIYMARRRDLTQKFT